MKRLVFITSLILGISNLFADSVSLQKDKTTGNCPQYVNFTCPTNTYAGIGPAISNEVALWADYPATNNIQLGTNRIRGQGPIGSPYDLLRFDSLDPIYSAYMGHNAGGTCTGKQNVGIGRDVFRIGTYAGYNVGIGNYAFYSITGAYDNVAIGYQSSYSQKSGDANVAIGRESLYDNLHGSKNVAIGNLALANTTNSSSVALGYAAGYRNVGFDNQFFIDNQDRGSLANETNKALFYGIFDVDPANQLIRLNALVVVNGDLVPEADGTRNLGSPSSQWKDLYMTGSTIYMNGQPVLSTTNGQVVVGSPTSTQQVSLLIVSNATLNGEIIFGPGAMWGGNQNAGGYGLYDSGPIIPYDDDTVEIGSTNKHYKDFYFGTNSSLIARLQIVDDNTNKWNSAYGWGDHSLAGYLKANGSVAWTGNQNADGHIITNLGGFWLGGILVTNIDTNAVSNVEASLNNLSNQIVFIQNDTNKWNSAYGWGDHSLAGYLKANGSVAWSGNQNADGNIITNLGGFWLGGVLVTNIDTNAVSNVEIQLGIQSNQIALLEEGTNRWNNGVTNSQPAVTLGSILPISSNAYDLGSQTLPYRHGYFTESSIYLGDYQVTKAKCQTWDAGGGGGSYNPTNTIVFTNFNFNAETCGVTYVTESAGTVTGFLPSVSIDDVGAWYRFVKLGAGTLVIDAADTDVIMDSGAGDTVYDNTAAETYANITLMLVQSNKWVSTSAHGTWVTTD